MSNLSITVMIIITIMLFIYNFYLIAFTTMIEKKLWEI